MYWILTAFAAVIGRLPATLLDRFARACAFVGWDLLRLRRSLVERNLAIAFPAKSPADRARIGKASLYNFVLTTLEFFRSAVHDIAGDTRLAGEAHVRSALAKGQGVYILCFHLGNWEAMGAACTRFLTPSYVLVKKVGSDAVDRWVSERRLANGFLTIKRRKKGDGLAGIREVLARGEIVGFVMDQARPGEPKLPFFDAPAKTNTSLAAIWRRLPAPIVPAFITRERLGRHVVEFLPELTLTVTDDSAADVLRHTGEFNAAVEQCVRRCPEQYFWMHNRWK